MKVYYNSFCKCCNREIKHKTDAIQLCIICKKKSKRLARRISASNYKNNKCEICGIERKTIDDLEMFDFHHVDRNNKSFELGDKIESRKWEDVKNELDKCMMLCANCHRKQHIYLRNDTVVKYAENLVASYR